MSIGNRFSGELNVGYATKFRVLGAPFPKKPATGAAGIDIYWFLPYHENRYHPAHIKKPALYPRRKIHKTGEFATSVRYNRAKPFPKLLMTLLLPAVTAVPVYLVCVKMSPEEATSLHESFGNKLVRSAETDRLNRFLRKCDTNQSMLQFYCEK